MSSLRSYTYKYIAGCFKSIARIANGGTPSDNKIETLFPSNKNILHFPIFIFRGPFNMKIYHKILLVINYFSFFFVSSFFTAFFFFLAPPFLIQTSALQSPYFSADLRVGVHGPHLGRVLLLGGHVQLHCVAVLGREK